MEQNAPLYNPSTWKSRIYIALIAWVAVIIAIYMGLYQWHLIDHVWDPVFGDQTHHVLHSDLSHQMRKWMRVPDAILGAVAYLGDVIFSLAGSTERWRDRPWLVVLFGIDVIPVGVVSAILVFMQGTVVGAWCFPCWITAFISLILIVLAYDEVLCCVLYLHRVWTKSRDLKLLWDTFWGKASETAYVAAQEIARERAIKKGMKQR